MWIPPLSNDHDGFEIYAMRVRSFMPLFEKDSLWLRRYRIRWLRFPSRFETFFKIKRRSLKTLEKKKKKKNRINVFRHYHSQLFAQRELTSVHTRGRKCKRSLLPFFLF